MTTQEIARPQVGLMLSCGEAPTATRNRPTKLDYIRAKPGALGQFEGAAQEFVRVYGDRPRVIDVIFVSDDPAECLDVRPKVYGASGLKAVGVENLAAYSPAEFDERIRAYDWELTTFPDDSPEPGTYTLKGRNDPVVTKMKLKVYATLRVSLPRVTGLMMLTEISTTSVRTMTNWRNALALAQKITGGVLVGIPFKLILRPARSRYWDPKEKKRKSTEFQEWVLESAHNLEELYRIAHERRVAIGTGEQRLALPPVRHDDPDRDAELIIVPSEETEIVEAAEVRHVDVEVFDEQGEFSFSSMLPDDVREAQS